jgi:hypothetical protein
MLAFSVVGMVVVAIAFAARVVVHAGRTPGGVDTWYYLAFADAFRRQPSWDVRLPQYLLQDERQSYPPLFPSLLSLVPAGWLRERYWTLSPLIDCAHLFLLYCLTARLTASVAVAGMAAAAYALTPHLISETRSLSARPFGALLHSLAMLVLLKVTLSEGMGPWAAVAVLAGACLFLSSAAMAAAYGFVCAGMSLWFRDPRYLLLATAGLVAAIVLSRGHMVRVIRNYLFAVRYWSRNHRAYGSHPIHDSPLYGGRPRPVQRAGFLGASTLQQLVRLVGENPFLLALPLAPYAAAPVTAHLHVWAVGLAAFAVTATVVPPLRAFGPGRSYMRAAVFPTAYTIAAGIGRPAGLLRPLGLATLACLALSLGAVVFFCLYVRGRPTEQTASIPEGLTRATRVLSELPPGGVLVLPFMYADYVCYQAGRPVVWGGHCGNLARFEWVAPVLSRPLADICAELGVRYVLLDERYIRFEELRLPETPVRRADPEGFVIYEYVSFVPVGSAENAKRA